MTTPAAVPADSVSASAAPMPKQEDRLLAAVAHLSFIAGFWLIAPIAIYLIKRKESRFVAFQALQSAILHIFWLLSGVGSFFAFVLLMMATDLSGRFAAGALGMFIPFLVMGGGGMLILLVHVYAAYEAWSGRSWSVPLAGRLTASIMGADEGSSKV